MTARRWVGMFASLLALLSMMLVPPATLAASAQAPKPPAKPWFLGIVPHVHDVDLYVFDRSWGETAFIVEGREGNTGAISQKAYEENSGVGNLKFNWDRLRSEHLYCFRVRSYKDGLASERTSWKCAMTKAPKKEQPKKEQPKKEQPKKEQPKKDDACHSVFDQFGLGWACAALQILLPSLPNITAQIEEEKEELGRPIEWNTDNCEQISRAAGVTAERPKAVHVFCRVPLELLKQLPDYRPIFIALKKAPTDSNDNGGGGGTTQEPETAVPAAPTGLEVTPGSASPNSSSHGKFILKWNDIADNETHYEVSNGVESSRYPANSGSGEAPRDYWPQGDATLPNGKYMCFKVRAVNNAGPSAWVPSSSPFYVCATLPEAITPD